jgi:ferritin
MKFILDAGSRVVIPAIEAPVAEFKFAKDAVKLSLDQEINVTEAINGIYDLALKENDHITSTFLHWFIKEQIEEVSSMDDLLKTVERAGEGGLLLVEQFLAQGSMGSSLGIESAGEAGAES